MHRIDAAGYAAGNLFTDGNPATGTPATVVDSAWLNDLQENIAQLIETAGISLVKGNYTQLIAALRAAGLFTTPAQFDNTTKAATTAFVKNSGLQINNIRTLNGATTLSAADLGGEIVANGTAYTVTLPVTTGLGVGAYGQLLIISNVATGNITVAAYGTDAITCGINSSPSFVLQPGDRAFLVLSSAGYWILVGGEASLKYSGTFGASLVSNGYQKLPSGLIIQWGFTNTSSSGVASVTLPIAFPGGQYRVTASASDQSVPNIVDVAPNTASAFSVSAWGAVNTGALGIRVATTISWIAVGY